MKVLLDTGVLGLLVHVNAELAQPCGEWMQKMLEEGATFVLPEVCDFELRRSLLKIDSHSSLSRLDALKLALQFESVTSNTWLRAADVWADCRKKDKPGKADDALDGDVILIAIAQQLAGAEPLVIATTNVKHLIDYVDAREWVAISH